MSLACHIFKRGEGTESSLAAEAFSRKADFFMMTEGASLGLWISEVPVWPEAKMGCVGAYAASIRQAGRDLLQAACRELARHGCEVAIGPMSGNTWRTHRLVTWSNGRPAFYLEPKNPPEFVEDFAAAGFELLSSYSSAIVDLRRDPPANLEAARRRLMANGVVIRPLDPNSIEAELRRLHELSLEAFAENFLYTPLPWEEFLAVYQSIAARVPPELVRLAEIEGQLTGFVFSLPDFSALERGEKPALIVKTLAVRAERRCAGLGSVLIDEAQRQARQLGFVESIHALRHERNQSVRVGDRFHSEVIRRYGLFSKVLRRAS